MSSVIWSGNNVLKVDISSGDLVIRFPNPANLDRIKASPSKIRFVQIGDTLRVSFPGILHDLLLQNLNDASNLHLILRSSQGQFDLGNEIRKTFTKTGTNSWERLFGGFWNDTIKALGGDDSVYGNRGNDTIFCGYGNDFSCGGDGNDSIAGQWGNDDLFGGDFDKNNIPIDTGNDNLSGGLGNDTLRSAGGNDTFWGGEGYDTFYIMDNFQGTVRIKDLVGVDDVISLPSLYRNSVKITDTDKGTLIELLNTSKDTIGSVFVENYHPPFFRVEYRE